MISSTTVKLRYKDAKFTFFSEKKISLYLSYPYSFRGFYKSVLLFVPAGPSDRIRMLLFVPKSGEIMHFLVFFAIFWAMPLVFFGISVSFYQIYIYLYQSVFIIICYGVKSLNF